jgi:hypothetical protein
LFIAAKPFREMVVEAAKRKPNIDFTTLHRSTFLGMKNWKRQLTTKSEIP